MIIPEATWRAYELTTFHASVDGEAIRLRVGELNESLDRVLERRGVETWAYLTAWNPRSKPLSRAENDQRQAKLIDELKARGLEMAEGEGEPSDDKWDPEASVLVIGIDARPARLLGVRYGQHAILHGRRGGPAKLMACCGIRPTTKLVGDIDALLPFIDIFSAPGFSFCEWRKAGLVMHFEMSDAAQAFIQAVYARKWVMNFDWPSWEETAQSHLDPKRVAGASIGTIRKLLTTHIRKDRFADGHLAEMFENGHILALLQRLRVLRG